MKAWPFYDKSLSRYWVKVFLFYAACEVCIQLLLYFTLNNYNQRISNLEFHGIMWLFQCLLVWPIWWVAQAVYGRRALVQVLVNLAFFAGYTICWFGPVQDLIRSLHGSLQGFTRSPADRIPATVDSISNLNYQFLKHGFRLSWFFLANYFYYYRKEEKQRLELALANKKLELKLLTWQLNPSFYFNAIEHLQSLAAFRPSNCIRPILQLAKVMEYVIYETKDRTISMSKELNFLGGYIDLLNQQVQNRLSIGLFPSGNFEGLRIAPLLLVGFIDKLAMQAGEGRNCRLELERQGAMLRFTIDADNTAAGRLISDDDAVYRRMLELYQGRFTLRQQEAGKWVQLELMLDEDA